MKILLLGKNGQVGWELQRSLAPLGELIALDRHSTEHCGDLARLDDLAQTVRRLKPGVIVNAAAYTAVDKAESVPDAAQLINAQAPAMLAEEALRLGAWLVHYSTDYVFEGSGTVPWREDDATCPLSVYGQTKLEGEAALRESGCRHLIFRTSWVYAARGSNFAKTMLRLGRDRDALNVIDDQIGAPTGAELLADVTAHALRHAAQCPEAGGLYHLAAGGATSWHGYASFVLQQARQLGATLKVEQDGIHPIPSNAYPLPAARPKNSRLNTTKLESTFRLRLPHWQAGVARMLAEILETKA